MRTTTLILILLAWIGALAAAPAIARAEADAAGVEFFEKRIRPVLAERCFECHSAGAKKLKGGLKLDSAENWLKGGDSGPALVPGDPEGSILIKALLYKDSELVQMPPDGKLSPGVIDDFIAWVKMGAPAPSAPAASPAAPPKKPAMTLEEGRQFWSFKPPVDSPPPAVKDAAWSKTSIDPFILAKLEEKGLAPAPPADRRTLIRRATFDMTGLPPTVEEIDAFLKDDSPDAFEKVVERLLASPRYGERWGRHWLDVVRYADSFDSRASEAQDIADAWRYRDWVVESFNNDMPYDRFVRLQIAGDLLGERFIEGGYNGKGLIATTMLAIGNWPGGDADKQKMVTDIVDDQVDVVSRGILGVTLACARCHDHKFDPFSQADYYAMAGIFFSSHILPGPGRKTEGSPVLHIPIASPAELERRAARERRIAELETGMKGMRDGLAASIAREAAPQASKYMLAARERREQLRLQPDAPLAEFAAERKLRPDLLVRWVAYLGFGEGDLMTIPIREVAGKGGLYGWKGKNDTPSAVVNVTDATIDFATIRQPGKSVTVHPSPTGAVAVAWRSPLSGKVKVSGGVADADPNCGDGIAWRVELLRGGEGTALAEGEIPNGGEQAFAKAATAAALESLEVKAGETIRLSILPKGGHACDTTTVNLDVAEIGGDTRAWSLARDLSVDPLQGNPHGDSHGNADTWRMLDLGESGKGDKQPGAVLSRWRSEIGKLALDGGDEPGAALLARAAESIQKEIDSGAAKGPASEDADAKLYKELVAAEGPFAFAPSAEDFAGAERAKFDAMAGELASLQANAPPPLQYAEGIQEGGVPDTEHAGIHDVAIHIRGNYARLGDIVPRRFPAILSEGAPPPLKGSGRMELAQWAASERNPLTARVIVNRVWQKRFGEGIVRTPGNFGSLGERPTHPELLDHLAVFLMKGGWSLKTLHREMILSATYQQSSQGRGGTVAADADNRLFGRMNRRRVEAEVLRDSMLAASGRLDLKLGGMPFRDINEPRRTIYFRTVRSDRTTFGALFDAADPTAIADKRTESTVAPQALFLMNNPFVATQAKALGELAIKAGSGDRERIEALYLRLYGRPASEEEIGVCLGLLRDGAEPGTLGDSESGGEAQAWERLCQALLCANEFAFID